MGQQAAASSTSGPTCIAITFYFAITITFIKFSCYLAKCSKATAVRENSQRQHICLISLKKIMPKVTRLRALILYLSDFTKI